MGSWVGFGTPARRSGATGVGEHLARRQIVELFSIACTTCQQRLIVRDASTIGEIQICPKCGSMVLVEPPADWSGPPVVPPPSPLPDDATDVFAEPPPAETPAGAECRSADANVEPPPAQLPVSQPPAAEPILPTDDWTSQAARRRQQWLLLGGAAVIGVALAFGLVGFLALRVANQSTAENTLDVEAPHPEHSEPASSPAKPAAPPEPAAETKPRAQPKPVAEPVTSPDKSKTKPVAAVPSKDQPAALPGTPLDHTPEESRDESASEQPAAEQPSRAAKTSPSEPPQAAPAKELSLDPGSLSETLKAFAPFIDPDANLPPEAMDSTSQDMPALDAQAVTTEPESVPRPAPRAVDVAARLQDKMAEVQFADVPLKSLLRFVMNFSTIPISIDPDALALVRATPQTKVSVRLADATIDQLLTAALSPLKLAHVPLGQQLIVTRPPLPDGQLRTVAHDVSDLVGNDPDQLARLAEMIVEMVQPTAWESTGGPGLMREALPSLVMQQEETILLRAIVFCERLRAARGLPPKSQFAPELFSLEPRFARAAPGLAKLVTVNYPQPTALTRILDWLSSEGGMEILVDWPSLVELGWSPDTETTVTANGQPLGEVLTDLLQPMGLTYRVVDPALLQVTSPTAADACWDIEFYPLPALPATSDSPAAWVTQLRSDLTGGAPAALSGVLVFDAPSRHLIAALPQTQQKKLAERLVNGGQ